MHESVKKRGDSVDYWSGDTTLLQTYIIYMVYGYGLIIQLFLSQEL